ncbi:hypothetical protein MSG28_015157 [Choristoneura fumiferana]|uniref:Uncharacterized protein n=1 Tax=Choristoneura fumiferana TaxID=7141 RepID=A0ACC0KZ67_CHOFU|nr:hypothetical protein MSG28_015157 [Choristoneura fumiferana]
MINPNYLYASTTFYLVCKIICYLSYLFNSSMYSKSKQALTSIPENDESEEDMKTDIETKWVPKKKHEVLKAKYKCLKKLFQIYDASVIGILPESYAHGDGFPVESRDGNRKSRRRKRSHRTRTDASAGTDVSSDLTDSKELLEQETATAVIRDLKIVCSNTVQSESKSRTSLGRLKLKSTVPSSTVHECTCTQASDVHIQHVPYLVIEKRKVTRFQSFVQRLLGIRRERPATSFVLGGHVLAASDNNINQRYSEGALRPAPAPLGCAASVRRACQLDATARPCPIAGCPMLSYGLTHLPVYPVPASRPRTAITSDTQTDPELTRAHDEKLKKIVSFFDKIADSDQILSAIKKNGLSKKSSVINSLVDKFRSGIGSYKWEPGTKIIRV